MSERIRSIQEELKKEERELLEINRIVKRMKENMVDKTPSHFSKREIVNAIFGSIILGLTFIFKGAIMSTAKGLDWYHVQAIIFITFSVLAAEIYFIGYSRVKEKSKRHFGQFLTKRLVTLYGIAIMVTVSFIFLFNLNTSLGTVDNIVRMTVLLSFPCSVGAAIPNLLQQY